MCSSLRDRESDLTWVCATYLSYWGVMGFGVSPSQAKLTPTFAGRGQLVCLRLARLIRVSLSS